MAKFRLRKRQNRLIGVIVCLLFSAFFFWAFLLIFSKRKVDLNTVAQITDTVRHTGIQDVSGSKVNAVVFALHFRDPLTTYTLYRAGRQYDDLLQKIKPGDVVTIFYEPQVRDINKDIVQLEHNGEIIISKSENENKSGVVSYMILAFALFLFGIACVLFRQFRKAARW